MVDNKRLSDVVVRGLRGMSYEQKCKIYEDNCNGCPFALVTTVISGTVEEHKNMDQAREALLGYSGFDYCTVKRECNYADERLSLDEIIMNTCRFWRTETIEGGNNEFRNCFIVIGSDDGKIDGLRKKFSLQTILQQGSTDGILPEFNAPAVSGHKEEITCVLNETVVPEGNGNKCREYSDVSKDSGHDSIQTEGENV